MRLQNNYLDLVLTSKGGEMASLTYKGLDILYKGDGPYWTGKNPTLFPFISSPASKKYTLDNKEYPCRNHGLIRYSELTPIVDNESQVTMRLTSNDETRKEYPFDFTYDITYRLDNKKVLINYEITNNDSKIMPFTFGLHPGFIVRDFNNIELIFEEDETGTLYSEASKTCETIKLGHYSGKQFLDDVSRLETVILKDLKSKYVILKTPDYSIKLDMSKYKYLGLWTKDIKANYICIEPWLSINDIANSDNPFRQDFEIEHLKQNETYKIDYSFEIID